MKFRPIHDLVLIKPTPPEQSLAGLELLSSDMQDKNEGTVIDVGDGVPLHNIKLNVTGEVSEATLEKIKEVIELIKAGRPMKVKPGDYVLYGRHAGTKVAINGEEHIAIREADVFGVLTQDNPG